MQTKIRSDPQLAWLTIGDAVEFDHGAMADSGYLPVQPPVEPIRILQVWSCSSCHSYPNWAEIVVHGGCIVSITAVPLDRETLARIHYLDADAYYVAEGMTDRKFPELTDEDVVPILRQLL